MWRKPQLTPQHKITNEEPTNELTGKRNQNNGQQDPRSTTRIRTVTIIGVKQREKTTTKNKTRTHKHTDQTFLSVVFQASSICQHHQNKEPSSQDYHKYILDPPLDIVLHYCTTVHPRLCTAIIAQSRFSRVKKKSDFPRDSPQKCCNSTLFGPKLGIFWDFWGSFCNQEQLFE